MGVTSLKVRAVVFDHLVWVLNTPPCLGSELPETSSVSEVSCKSGAIAGWIARAAGGVEVDGGLESVRVSEPPLQAIAAIKTKPRAMPIIVLRINLDPDFNLVSLFADIV